MAMSHSKLDGIEAICKLEQTHPAKPATVADRAITNSSFATGRINCFAGMIGSFPVVAAVAKMKPTEPPIQKVAKMPQKIAITVGESDEINRGWKTVKYSRQIRTVIWS